MIKQIPNHRQYSIDSESQLIYRTQGGKDARKPIKQTFHKVRGKEFPNGYFYVTLLTQDYDLNGEIIDTPTYKPVSVHRLMCLTFLERPTEKHVWVNHKDGDKLNNTLDNLEWTTISQNIQHAFDTGLKKIPKGPEHWLYGKKVSNDTRRKMSDAKKGIKHPKFTGYYYANFKRFESAHEAAKYLKMNVKTLYNRCHNPKFRLKGFYFVPC
jgi:hypothetical protein